MENINLIDQKSFYQKKGFWLSLIVLAIIVIVLAMVWYIYGQDNAKRGSLSKSQIEAISKAFSGATTTKLTAEQTKAISAQFRASPNNQLSPEQINAISQAFAK
jgi:uncharacterized protein (UPF0333 family)